MGARSQEPRVPRARILLVDDDADIRASVGRVLRLLGHRVDYAASGNQALAKVRRAAYDVAILDIRLPDLSGIEVLHRVADMRPDMAVVMLTGYGSLETAVEALRAQAVDYLSKPATVGDISRAIASALERRAGRPAQQNQSAKRFLEVGPIALDRDLRLVTVAGSKGTGIRRLYVTRSEEAVLAHLMAHSGVSVPCRELAAALGYEETEEKARKLVRPHISRIRKKIEPDPSSPRMLVTVPGLGYTFLADSPVG
jgi:two-component system KDP operon response regulator KdpE